MTTRECNGVLGKPGCVKCAIGTHIELCESCPGCRRCHADCATCGGTGLDNELTPAFGYDKPCTNYQPEASDGD